MLSSNSLDLFVFSCVPPIPLLISTVLYHLFYLVFIVRKAFMSIYSIRSGQGVLQTFSTNSNYNLCIILYKTFRGLFGLTSQVRHNIMRKKNIEICVKSCIFGRFNQAYSADITRHIPTCWTVYLLKNIYFENDYST